MSQEERLTSAPCVRFGNLYEHAQGVVHGLFVGKCLGHIGAEVYDRPVCPIALVILSPDELQLGKVIFRPEIVFIFFDGGLLLQRSAFRERVASLALMIRMRSGVSPAGKADRDFPQLLPRMAFVRASQSQQVAEYGTCFTE